MAARQKCPVGSLIRLVLADGSIAFVQYVGDGVRGDAVRVLRGRFNEDPSPEELRVLSDGPERFIAQTFLRQLLKCEGVAVCGEYATKPVTDLTPAWLITPASKDPQKQWVVSERGAKPMRMLEYRRLFPD